jgi:tetratricopeptide (TPR) repeat protein
MLSGLQVMRAQEGYLLNQLEQKLPAAKDTERARILFMLINHYASNDLKKAQTLSAQLLALGKKTNDVSIQVMGLTEKANLLRRRSQRDSAQYLLRQASILSNGLKDERLMGLIDSRYGLLYSDKGNYDSAGYYFTSAARHFREAREDYSVAGVLANHALTFQRRGRMAETKLFLDSASALIGQALKKDSSYWPARQAAVIANYQGIYTTRIGKYEESLRWNLQSLHYFESIGDIRSQAATLQSMGTTYRKLKKFTSAMEQFRRALNKFGSVHDRSGEGACLESMALVYNDLHQVDSAATCFEQALKIATELNDKTTQGSILNNMGVMYYIAKDYHQATRFYEKSFAVRGGFEKANLHDFTTAMINLGQTATLTGQLDKAGDYLARGLRAARQLQSPDYEKSALEGLVEYFKAKQNFRAALSYQDSLIRLKDSLFVADSKQKVAEMEVQYETSRKEQEIRLLKVENQYARLRQIAWMSGLGITLVLAILVFYSLQSRKARIQAELTITRQEKEGMENQLRYKDQELTNFATYITEKDDFMEAVLAEMNALDLKNESGQKQLEKLIVLIRDNINLAGSRDEFNAHLTHVYGSFISKLEKRYPELTDHEKRLATLLRVNLSSKQIASVFNISPKSVDMSRYRLRKKMGLQAEEDLHEVLKTL